MKRSHSKAFTNDLSEEAKKILKWSPVWNIDKTLNYTNDWYLKYYSKKYDMNKITANQIMDYQKLASKKWNK